MELIGQILKSERTKKNIDLVEISHNLNISCEILENIEDNNFPEYISTVFLIGHIRSYATILELDQAMIIKKFKIQVSYNKSNSNTELSKPIQIKNIISIPKTLSFASAVVILSSFYFLFIKSNNIEIDYAMKPDVPENLIYELEKIEMELALKKKKDEALKNENDKNNIKLIINDLGAITNSSSVVASTPKTEELNKNKKNIILKFINPTWIQIRDQKENIIISKLMKKGEEYSYKTTQNFFLTAGNAGNIIVSMGGEIKGKAGKFGEVIESLAIDNNFNN